MKKYIKELVLVLVQGLVFYVLPLFCGPTDMMGLVFLIALSVFVLSLIMGILSKEKIKYAYPLAISIIFIPSTFIYYNVSALIHAVWYFVISIIGLLIGMLIKKFFIK